MHDARDPSRPSRPSEPPDVGPAPPAAGPDPLAVPLARGKLHAVCEAPDVPRATAAALLAAAERRAAFRAPSAHGVARFLQSHLLALGVVLLFAAAALFLAANWSVLTGWTRMGLVAAAIVGASLAGARFGTTTAGGRASLALAGLLTGPLLFVYGQTFQTGADEWLLFAAWAALLTPYALIVRHAGLSFVVVALVQLAFGLACDQVWDLRVDDGRVAAVYAAFNLVASIVVDAVARAQARRASSMSPRHRWLSRAFMLAAVAPTLPALLEKIADDGAVRALDRFPLHAAALAFVLVVGVLWFRRAPKDLFALAGAALSVVMLAASFTAHALDDVLGFSNAGAVFWTGVLTMAQMALVGVWIRAHLKSGVPDEEDVHDDDGPPPGPVAPRAPATTFRALVDDARLHGDAVDEAAIAAALARPPTPPLAVRALLGFGIWIGAGMVAAIVDIVHRVLDLDVVRATVGALFFALAAFVSRKEAWGDVRVHVTVLSVVLGEVLVGSVFPRGDTQLFWACFAAMQALVVVVVANPLSRFTAILGMALALWGMLEFDRSGLRPPMADELLVLAFAAASLATWTLRDRLLSSAASRLASPLGYGAAVSAAMLVAMNLGASQARGAPLLGGGALAFGLAGTAVLVALGVRRALVARDGAGAAPSEASIVAAGVVAFVVAALSSSTPEILLALLFVFVGHVKREKGMYALGVLLLALSLFTLSRTLHGSLADKAVVLAAIGVALLAARALVGRALPVVEDAPVVDRAGLSYAASFAVPAVVHDRRAARRASAGRALPVLAATTFALGVPFFLATEKAAVATHGTPILLELAPRDPRSLFQGDYMELRYARIAELEHRTDRTATIALRKDAGDVVVGARFVGATEAVADDEVKVVIRRGRWGEWKLGAQTYFFEQGKAERFSTAKYGELRVGPFGEVVLVGLRDAGMSRL